MGAQESHEVSFANVWRSTGYSVEQCASRPAGGRAWAALARLLGGPLGGVCEPSLWPQCDFFGDVDLAALAGLPGDSARYEGRSGLALPARHQSTGWPRMALLAAAGRGAGMALLCSGGVQ